MDIENRKIVYNGCFRGLDISLGSLKKLIVSSLLYPLKFLLDRRCRLEIEGDYEWIAKKILRSPILSPVFYHVQDNLGELIYELI